MKTILLFIIAFSAVLYFYKLHSIPSGVYVDEATVAFNAKAIFQTGADEYAVGYPYLFRLFGSYTPPLFIYFASFIVGLFNQDILYIRAVSAVATTLSTFILYKFLVSLDLIDRKNILVTVMLFAISPWVLFNARLGYETTLAFSVFFSGIYFCYLALADTRKLIPAVVLLSLSTYISYPARYLFLVFVPTYLLVFRKQIFTLNNFSNLKKVLIITFFLHLPNLLLAKNPAFWVKNSALFENGIATGMKNFIGQLLDYYSPKAIFFESPDIDLQHTIPGISLLYSWMVIPFLIGLYFLIKNRQKISYKYILFLFIILVIPASLSGHFMSVQRAFQFIIPLIIVVGLGIDYLSKRFPSFIFLGLLIILIPFSLTRLYRSYFVLLPVERALAWNYGYDQLALVIKLNPTDNFLIDNSRNPRNYIELLYHLDYPADVYQTEVDSVYKDNYYQAPLQDYKYKFGNVVVRSVNWETDPCSDQVIVGDFLTISAQQASEHKLIKKFEIKDKLGNPIFVGYKTNPAEKCRR